LQGKGAFYDLETLVYFVKNMGAKFRDYLQKATKELGKGKAVSFIDRKARGPWARAALPLGGPCAPLPQHHHAQHERQLAALHAMLSLAAAVAAPGSVRPHSRETHACCGWLQDLTEYLEGKSDHSQYIQLAVPDFEVRGLLGLACAAAGPAFRTADSVALAEHRTHPAGMAIP
jgi:hypothetical protein